MKIVTSEQMRALDMAAIQKHSIPSLQLMERAGGALCDETLSFAGRGDGVIVIAGGGNNGGDGLVAARLMAGAGAEVTVFLLAPWENLSQDAKANLERLEQTAAKVKVVVDERAFDDAVAGLKKASAIVDAIFGTGLARQVEGLAKHAIDFINGYEAAVVSADIPSGLSADSGDPLGAAVSADVTVTFGLPKRGLVSRRGNELAGRIVVADIGIPASEIAKISTDLSLIEPSDFMRLFPQRARDSHKGTFGHIAVFAGSGGHLGAGYLTSMAALRAGAGLVTYAMPAGAFDKFDTRYPEIMCDAMPDAGRSAFGPESVHGALELASGKGSLAIGPAIGTAAETRSFLNDLVARTRVPAVIDADGLNLLDVERLKARRSHTVLTPHPGEMGRLSGASTAEVQSDRIGFALKLAEAGSCTVVLKGNQTVVAEPGGRASINPTGNPGMATAGMGDALTGIIASFMARGMDAADAARAAVYLHGLAGDMAAEELGESSVIASDVIARIGRAIEKCRGLG